MNINETLRRELERSGMSQNKLAKAVSINQSIINRWVNEETTLSLAHAETLLTYFGYALVKKRGRHVPRRRAKTAPN